MKKLLLPFIISIISLNVFSQDKINTDDLIGYWRCLDESATELFFWKDVSGKLQVQEVSSLTGEPLDIIALRVDKNSIFIRTFFAPTNYGVDCILRFVDKKTLKCEVKGEFAGALVYTKVK